MPLGVHKRPLEANDNELNVKEMLMLIDAIMSAVEETSDRINKKVSPCQMSKALITLESLTRRG